jgi:Zn finger protein HypA/HybF involved in hydrogenase expression
MRYIILLIWIVLSLIITFIYCSIKISGENSRKEENMKTHRQNLRFLDSHKIKCSHCGNTLTFNNQERLICPICKTMNYKNSKIRFEYEMKKHLKH